MIYFSKKNLKGTVVLETSGFNINSGKSRTFKSNTGTIILCTDELDLVKSSRLFNRVGKYVSEIFDNIHDSFRNQIELQSHTLKSIQAQLSQKIEQIVGISMQGGSLSFFDQKRLISKKVSENPDEAAEVFLYLSKRIYELDAHMSSFELLHMGEFVKLDLQFHSIRKLLLNIWHAFDEQYTKKNIRYTFSFEESYAEEHKLQLDYKTINTAFYNFFDNCIKYVIPDSEIIFRFIEHENNSFELNITMISLVIKQDEISKIFELGFRCESCKDLKGSGVGMHVFKKALEMNGLKIKLETNSTIIKELNGKQYSKNKFIITGSHNLT